MIFVFFRIFHFPRFPIFWKWYCFLHISRTLHMDKKLSFVFSHFRIFHTSITWKKCCVKRVNILIQRYYRWMPQKWNVLIFLPNFKVFEKNNISIKKFKEYSISFFLPRFLLFWVLSFWAIWDNSLLQNLDSCSDRFFFSILVLLGFFGLLLQTIKNLFKI